MLRCRADCLPKFVYHGSITPDARELKGDRPLYDGIVAGRQEIEILVSESCTVYTFQLLCLDCSFPGPTTPDRHWVQQTAPVNDHDALQHPIQALSFVLRLSTSFAVSSTVDPEFPSHARPSKHTRQLSRSGPHSSSVSQQTKPVLHG